MDLKSLGLPVKYLGVPLISSRLVDKDCKVIVEQAKNRIGDWKNKSLSFAGRLELCKSVISSMHVYWASVLVIPKGIIYDIQQLIRGFLWCNGEYKRGKTKVAWDSIFDWYLYKLAITLINELKIYSEVGTTRVAREDDRGVTEGREDVREVFQQRGSGAKRKLSRCGRNQMGNEPILALPEGADDFVVYYDARSKDLEACLEKGEGDYLYVATTEDDGWMLFSEFDFEAKCHLGKANVDVVPWSRKKE
ncbi:hypothetical protein Tco_0206508 [Tanacetum coccineum]